MSKTNQSDITNYTFCFKCPVGWDNLNQTDENKVRYCNLCKKNVYYVETQTELDNLSSKGACVAFAPYNSEIEEAKRKDENYEKTVCQNCRTPFHIEDPFCLICGKENPNSIYRKIPPIRHGAPEVVVMGQIIMRDYCDSCHKEVPFSGGRYSEVKDGVIITKEILCNECKSKVEEKKQRSWWKFWK